MREYVIQNVDFIQLTVNPGEDRVYFPVSTHLQGKKVLYLEVLNPDKGLDLSGRYPILSLDSLFVTLYDTSGNLIIDTLFINYFSTLTGNDLPRIDSEIDWERSFISVPVSVKQTSVLFFSVYIGSENLPVPSQKNLYNLTLPSVSGTMEISLFRKVQALKEEKITGVYAMVGSPTGKPDQLFGFINGYLYLVPKDKTRYINYIPLQFIYGMSFTSIYENYTPISLQRKFIDPVEIDFNRSKILIRSTDETIQTLNLSFYYE